MGKKNQLGVLQRRPHLLGFCQTSEARWRRKKKKGVFFSRNLVFYHERPLFIPPPPARAYVFGTQQKEHAWETVLSPAAVRPQLSHPPALLFSGRAKKAAQDRFCCAFGRQASSFALFFGGGGGLRANSSLCPKT